MKNRIVGIIATLLMLTGCSSIAGPALADIVQGYTIEDGPACFVNDLSPESVALITKWFNLSLKARNDINSLTPEDIAAGSDLVDSGQCGYLIGDTPVVIVLLDGTISLARFPDGTLMGFADDAFREATDSFKEFRE